MLAHKNAQWQYNINVCVYSACAAYKTKPYLEGNSSLSINRAVLPFFKMLDKRPREQKTNATMYSRIVTLQCNKPSRGTLQTAWQRSGLTNTIHKHKILLNNHTAKTIRKLLNTMADAIWWIFFFGFAFPVYELLAKTFAYRSY